MAKDKEPEKTAAAPEAGAEGAPTEGTPAPNNKKKLMMLASGGLAVVGIVVAAGVFFLFGGKSDEHAEADHAAKAAELPPMAMYDVPEFTLNLLQDENAGGPRFLKIQLSLELANAADSENMTKLLPKLQDDWGGFLRQLRPADLQGSASLQRLKEGLLRRATQSLAPLEVKAVYIRDLLVQ